MKKFLIIALALMLALSLVACKDENPDENPGNGTINLNPEGTGETPGANGSENGTTANSGNAGNGPNTTPIDEPFTDLEQTIFIVASAATIRSEAYVSDSTVVTYVVKDTELKSTGYSANWYKIEYEVEVPVETESLAEGETQGETETKTEIKTCYVHKSVACVKDLTAVELEEPITIYITAAALYVRSYYDFEVDDNRMFALQQGDEVTAVAKGDGWYKIQLSPEEDGSPRFGYISSNEKYVSTTKPGETTEQPTEDGTTVEESTTVEEATTVEETTTVEEATTEVTE